MNILFDLGHPAHVHLFRNAAHSLMQRGHGVSIAIRDKPIIKKLLDFYGLEYSIASKARSGSFGLACELIEHDFNVLRLVRQHKIDLMAGTSASVAHVSRITRARSFVISEDDAAVTDGRFTNMGALLFTSSVTTFLMGLISEQITALMYKSESGSSSERS